MPIEFKCKSCSTTLRVPEEHRGKQAKCPKCQTLNLVQADSFQAAPLGSGDMFAGAASPKETLSSGALPSTNPFQAGPSSSLPLGRAAGRAYQIAHRGPLVLTLGIVSLVCNVLLIPGILAWVFGKSDLKQMQLGQMDPEGRGMTQAGMILGIISTALVGLVLLAYLGIFIVFFIAIAGAGI